MRKIPTVLVRNPEDRKKVLPEIVPGLEWVLTGEALPTRKYDGTGMLLDSEGKWWARREVKPGKQAPANFQLVHHDLITNKLFGYEPAEQSPFAKFHKEALLYTLTEDDFRMDLLIPGTYELYGPKIQGNPEKVHVHKLIRHAAVQTLTLVPEPPYTVEDLILMVRSSGLMGWEGIVWHHPDGRMGKLKVRDL